MKLLTELALRRSSVTVLIIILLLVGGVFTYRSLQVELFPEIEFPLVTISTFYPSATRRPSPATSPPRSRRPYRA